ncbi:unnamed protein product, partial [Discosporangium mesarthrocarpum]
WPQPCKVWVSSTGVLVHTIHVDRTVVAAVAPHPTNPFLLATAGNDGRVCMWDLREGRLGCRWLNTLEAGPQSEVYQHGSLVPVLDVGFSPDGMTLVVSDCMGRWTLYVSGPTLDETEAGRRVPQEQHFTSDSRELLRDENDNVLDAFTRLPPHLAQTGILVDSLGNLAPDASQPTKSGLKGPQPLPPVEMAIWKVDLLSRANDLKRILKEHTRRMEDRVFMPRRAAGGASVPGIARVHTVDMLTGESGLLQGSSGARGRRDSGSG